MERKKVLLGFLQIAKFVLQLHFAKNGLV